MVRFDLITREKRNFWKTRISLLLGHLFSYGFFFVCVERHLTQLVYANCDEFHFVVRVRATSHHQPIHGLMLWAHACCWMAQQSHVEISHVEPKHPDNVLIEMHQPSWWLVLAYFLVFVPYRVLWYLLWGKNYKAENRRETAGLGIPCFKIFMLFWSISLHYMCR